MKERKRKHDDVHWPMAGKGKKANRKPRGTVSTAPKCRSCGAYPDAMTHLCDERLIPAEQRYRRY